MKYFLRVVPVYEVIKNVCLLVNIKLSLTLSAQKYKISITVIINCQNGFPLRPLGLSIVQVF